MVGGCCLLCVLVVCVVGVVWLGRFMGGGVCMVSLVGFGRMLGVQLWPSCQRCRPLPSSCQPSVKGD